MKWAIEIWGILCVVSLVMTSSAHAYLDPGSGSMLLQLVLGGVAGLAVLIKLYWHRLLAVLGVREKNEDMPETPNLQPGGEPTPDNKQH